MVYTIYGDLGGGLLLFEPHYIDYFMSTIKNSNQQGFFRNDWKKNAQASRFEIAEL